MPIEFRENLKGNDVLIIIGKVADMEMLSEGSHAWASYPAEMLMSSVMPLSECVEITLQRHDSPDALTARDLLPGVI
ncbi:hypothetical protein [Xanthomonas sacchari]|uniref:hypothetical protein n=1 Tax=Xanthomonas sacchari TaxID=56458 RepID=UPI003B20BC43